MAARTRRALRWLFGDEGTVATEPEMQIVMVATAMTVSGTFVVSPIVSTLTGPFGVSAARSGQLITAFVAPSILLAPVMGVLADRVGRKRVLVSGLVVFGVAGTSIAGVSSFAAALALRAVQGMGHAAINPIGVALLGDLYGGDRETTAQGLRAVAIQTMSLTVPPLSGLLVLVGWRFPFLLYLLALAIAAAAWVRLPDVEPSGAASLRAYASDLFAAVTRPELAVVLLSFSVRFALTFGFLTYVSVLLGRAFGASAVASGVAVSAYALVSLVAATQVGRLVAVRDAALVLLGGFLLAGTGMALVGVAGSYPVVVAGVVLFGAGGGVTGPVQKSLVTQLSSRSLRAGAVSSAMVFQAMGQTGGPLLMGLLLGVAPVAGVFAAFGVGTAVLGAALAGIAYRAKGRRPPSGA